MALELTNNLDIQINNNPAMRGYEVYLGNRTGDKPLLYDLTITEREYSPGQLIRPTAVMTRQHAQQVMDELWRAGVRPNNGQGSMAQVEALQNHLADMQKISFSLLDKATSQPYVIKEMN